MYGKRTVWTYIGLLEEDRPGYRNQTMIVLIEVDFICFPETVLNFFLLHVSYKIE
jgi:hypothetical protein